MTIYVHFTDKTRTAVKLFNVDAVSDAGNSTVIVRMTFAEPRSFEGVARVAIEPSRDE